MASPKIDVRLTPDLLERVEAEARKRSLSRSALVLSAIEHYLDDAEKPPRRSRAKAPERPTDFERRVRALQSRGQTRMSAERIVNDEIRRAAQAE